MVRATRIKVVNVSSSRSIQWSISARGTTSVWPGRSGLIDRNATQRSSRQTKCAGNSPAMIRVKTLGNGFVVRYVGNLAVAVPKTRVSPASLVMVMSISTVPSSSSMSVTTPVMVCG